MFTDFDFKFNFLFMKLFIYLFIYLLIFITLTRVNRKSIFIIYIKINKHSPDKFHAFQEKDRQTRGVFVRLKAGKKETFDERKKNEEINLKKWIRGEKKIIKRRRRLSTHRERDTNF